MMERTVVSWLTVVALIVLSSVTAYPQSAKPNILVIWGDDIGTWNISHNSHGS